ncbi:MjaI family restriction endonuclease [Parabacteroides sp.]
MAKSKVKIQEVSQVNGTQKIELPKYSSQIINLANGYAKATKPANVGQVSEDIKEFRDDDSLSGHTNQDWIKWHKEKYPDGIQKATDATWEMFEKMRESINTVTKDDIKKWEEDFVYSKTYDGLMVQNAIIQKIAKEINTTNYRLATPEEESQGIDGFINGHPVQIKSETYDRTGKLHNEDIQCVIISYVKKNKDIIFDYNKKDFQ